VRGLDPGAYDLIAIAHPKWIVRAAVAAGTGGVELRMPDAATVRGCVLAPDGSPLSGIAVHAVSLDAPDVGRERPGGGSALTDREGRFVLDALCGERFAVRADANHRLLREEDGLGHVGWDGSADGVAAREVRDVPAGATDVVLRFRTDGPEISGIVRDAKGAPRGATVRITPEAGDGPTSTVVTGDDGFFRVRGLAPGAYRVDAMANAGSGRAEHVRAGTTGLTIDLR
jgi:hypothetical protein